MAAQAPALFFSIYKPVDLPSIVSSKFLCSNEGTHAFTAAVSAPLFCSASCSLAPWLQAATAIRQVIIAKVFIFIITIVWFFGFMLCHYGSSRHYYCAGQSPGRTYGVKSQRLRTAASYSILIQHTFLRAVLFLPCR